MLKLVMGPNWRANREAILRRIALDVKNRQGGRVLMVPELISHDTERRLSAAAGDTASRYAEVLSFSRLASRVFDRMGNASQECLDDGGRVVAMAAAARQLSGKLKSYASVETKPEFLSGLIDCVDEFKRCCITSADLNHAVSETEGSLAQKLEELALLMESYDALCSLGKRDPRDQMTWLLEYLELGTYAQEHIFYIDGFPDFTRQNLAIIEHLIKASPCVTVSVNCDRPDSPLLAFEKAGDTAAQLIKLAARAGVQVETEFIPGNDPLETVRNRLFQGPFTPGCARERVSAYHADSLWRECMGAADQIRNLITAGCRYRDITLVCTDMAAYLPLVSVIFERFHIPVYQSGTEPILQKGVIQTVLTALDAALSGYDQRDTLRYLHSALAPVTPDVCDLVENYVILWGIRGLKWAGEWDMHPEGLGAPWTEKAKEKLRLLNDVRSKVILPLERLRKAFREAANLKDQATAVYGFLDEIELAQRLSQMADEMDSRGENRNAQILNQLWDILISALEQMYDVLGDTHWDAEHFVRLFRLLLSQYKVGTIPPVLDAVQMGPVSSMRCHQQKHLILLGAQEGNLPCYSGSKGVLTDQERFALRQLGVPLTGGGEEGIQAEFAEIYGVICGAEESVRIFYSGDQPSFVFRRLADMAGSVQQVDDSLGFALADGAEAACWLAKWGQDSLADKYSLLDTYREAIHKANYTLGNIQSDNIRSLYGHTLNLSASQIDRQAECRLSYFLRYGLSAKERKEVSIDPAEFGTYVHAVLENTARHIRDMGGFHNVSLEETLAISHKYSEEYFEERFGQLSSDRHLHLFRRNAAELDMIVEELWEELRNSEFEPREFEVNFGGEGLPPIAIPNGSMNAILRGFVDRVDSWFSGGSNYYRVVDYKTGKKDFNYSDVFNGVGLQMLLYMFALRQNGEALLGTRPVPAGVQYFPARAPYVTADGKLTEEEARIKHLSQWKRKGLLLEDADVLKAMEPGDSPRRMNYKVTKDGTLSGDVADRDQLKQLESYVFQVLSNMVEDIASGNVTPNPYTRGSAHDACAYCPYGSICHKDTVEGRRNYKSMDSDEFWNEIGKELHSNGR